MKKLPKFEWIVSSEFDAVNLAHQNVLNDSVQLDAGTALLEFRALIFDDMSIVLDAESLASVNDLRPDSGHTLIALLSLNNPTARWCGIDVDSDIILVQPGGRDYVIGLPAGYKGIHLTIPNALLAELNLLPDEFMVPGQISTNWMLPAGRHGGALRCWLFRLFGSPDELYRIANDHVSAALFRDKFLGGLGSVFDEALNGSGVQFATTRTNGRYGLARRARDMVVDMLHEPVGAEDLARELDVSRQVLWHAFRDIYQTSPYQFILGQKLMAVRRELRGSHTSRRSIAEIAERYGFTDISRFGQFYRRQFGEVPSSTLGGSDGEFNRR